MRRLRRDDGVSEVLGFVLSFALSAIFLLLAMSSFWAARHNSETMTVGTEMKAIADRISARIVDAGLLGDEFPNAVLNLSVEIPKELAGRPYYVAAFHDAVWVNASDGSVQANATTFRLDANLNYQVSGRVESSAERVIVTYSKQGAYKDIHIHGD